MSSKAVLSKKRGAGKAGPARKPTLDKAQALLGRLATPVVAALIPVFEKYALPGASGAPESSGPAIDFPTFAEHMETLVNMIDAHGDIDIESPECAALGTFICNHGTKEDNAEALLAIMPVATRVFRRCGAEEEARRTVVENKK